MLNLKFCIGYAVFNIAINLAQVSAFTFNRNLIEIFFSPYVAQEFVEHNYNEFDLQVMIKQIATRFTKIVQPQLILTDRCSSVGNARIPLAIALFNRNQTPVHPPLELSMEFVVSSLDRAMYTRTSLDIVAECANEANKIFSGTVKSILFQYDGRIKEGLTVDSDRVVKELSIAKSTLFNISTKYTLGVMLQSYECAKSEESYLLRPILAEVDIVQFAKWPSSEDYFQGVEKSVQDFTSVFDTCIQNVREINNRVKIGFRTRWADVNPTGIQNMSALVYFWEEVATWAGNRNTTVTFHEAFDVQYRGSSNTRTYGWWRLSPDHTFKRAEDYIFVEKTFLIQTKSVNPTPPYDTFNNLLPPDVPSADTRPVGIGIGVGGGVLILVLATLLIYLYKKKIRQAQLTLGLTKVELDQFFYGMRTQCRTYEGNGDGHPFDSFSALPYSKDYEVERADFHIDMGNKLGSGQFGLILLGTWNNVDVAVKTINPNTPSLFTLKGMMSEIKVLSHLGGHKHIVCMLGSCTSELEQGNVYLLLELCINGSLDKRLKLYRDRSPQYDNVVRYVKDPSTGYLNPTGNVGNTQQFLRWTMEILAGMEFLALKHVVHADLATRNVLLTANLTCKVSDFGLSRRLYNYTNYVKTREEPMPWRWMAPEALRQLEFNEKTDVWAFGVTIWEIFSFGDVPYPGYTWDGVFLTRLENGLRLDEPSQKCNGVYAIMKQCWEYDPVPRPTFAELKIKFDVLI